MARFKNFLGGGGFLVDIRQFLIQNYSPSTTIVG